MRRYLFVLLLAGCAGIPNAKTIYHPATPEELARIEAQRAQEQRDKNKIQTERVIDKYSPLCEGLGYKRDTDPWRQCILSRIDAADRARGSVTTCNQIGGTLICSSSR